MDAAQELLKISSISPEVKTMGAAQDEVIGGLFALKNQFPWIVRVIGGCNFGRCAGSLISPRIVASAFHCAVTGKESSK